MLLIQITAAQGPVECELAVRLTWRALLREAAAAGYTLKECDSNPTAAGYKSVLLHVQPQAGRPHNTAEAPTWLQPWLGSIQWVFASPLRPSHRRKNWFVAVQRCPDGWNAVGRPAGPQGQELRDEDIVYCACRASGKGGQHVNTTDSAVHALHVPSGIAVKVMTGRSQHTNKRLARALIAWKLTERAQAAQAAAQQERTRLHGCVQRGNPVRVLHHTF